MVFFSATFKETRKISCKKRQWKKILPYWNFVVFLYWLPFSFDKKKKRQEELLVMSGRESFPPSKITKKKKIVPGHQLSTQHSQKKRRKRQRASFFVYVKQFFLISNVLPLPWLLERPTRTLKKCNSEELRVRKRIFLFSVLTLFYMLSPRCLLLFWQKPDSYQL